MSSGRDPVIASAVRTPIGRANKGSLKDTRPDDLLALVVKEAFNRVAGLTPERIDDIVVGCAFPEGEQGMNLGRIAVFLCGFPFEVPGNTVNRFCASGLQAIAYAAQEVSSGFADVVIAAGVEAMSRVPMRGFNFSANPKLSGTNSYIPMGLTAENVAARYGISREDQDAFAYQSHMKAVRAWSEGKFDDHVIPVKTTLKVVQEDGSAVEKEVVLSRDECPRPNTSPEILATLKPAFKEGGTVTAGNSSPLNDGAAACVIMAREVAEELGVKPLATIRYAAAAGVDPAYMGIGPVPAVRKVLKKAGLKLDDIDLIELNEAFASQALACVRELGIDPSKLNVNGGAIAIGHPLGCTGCRIMADLLHEMKRRNARWGLETMCIGGGQGMAMIVEREQ